jgi:DNA-binding NarL/FixJ family response regulator
LSRRECEVLALLAGGSTNADIAARLFLSTETVKSHVRNAMLKLGARTRTQAVVRALERGDIQLPPPNHG